MSTAEDLCRFAAFLLDGDDRVFGAETLAEMRTAPPPPGDDIRDGGYGLGLQLFRLDGRLFFGHGGSMPGFLATLCVSAADGVAGSPGQRHVRTRHRRDCRHRPGPDRGR